MSDSIAGQKITRKDAQKAARENFLLVNKNYQKKRIKEITNEARLEQESIKRLTSIYDNATIREI